MRIKELFSFIVLLFILLTGCDLLNNPFIEDTFDPAALTPESTPEPTSEPTSEPTPIPGDLIINMVVYDTDNAADWSVRVNIQEDDDMYGDRVYLISTLPLVYAGSDWIRTAGDSKAYTEDPLVTFTVTADADVLVAHDDRITSKPSWLTSGWTDTGNDIVCDEEGTLRYFSVFSKTFTADSLVSLGSNGQSAGCIGYIVIVKE